MYMKKVLHNYHIENKSSCQKKKSKIIYLTLFDFCQKKTLFDSIHVLKKWLVLIDLFLILLIL
jgi:hypothetical protein